jgi:hypothetical protein
MDGMSTGNSVSLHIRRGDYVSNPVTSAFHGICSMSYYKRAVTYLIEHWTDLHVYVFSDDIKWAKNHLVLNHPCEFVSGRFFIPDYVEMELMRHCKHHIIANSTFSWWAAWLSENRFKTVIAPENWVIKKEFDFSSIYLNNWIKI